MTQKHILFSAALPLFVLLSACGDDLESRQAAAEERMGERAGPASTAEETPVRARASSAPEETADADDGETGDAGEAAADTEVVYDASPDELIDNAQGFAPTPMDSAEGFDPSPLPPETFND